MGVDTVLMMLVDVWGVGFLRRFVMMRCYCGDGLRRCWCWSMLCVGSASILDSLTASKSVEICRILLESLRFSNLLRFAGF
jgi:hypothetical protein